MVVGVAGMPAVTAVGAETAVVVAGDGRIVGSDWAALGVAAKKAVSAGTAGTGAWMH